MLLTNEGWTLAPFYDLINVKLVLTKDKEECALLLGGKKENLSKQYFDHLGAVLKLNNKQIQAVYKRLAKWLPPALLLINNSFLNTHHKGKYKKLITERTSLFYT